jgi:hypothetical protein
MSKLGNHVMLSGRMVLRNINLIQGVQYQTPVVDCVVQIREHGEGGDMIVHEHPVKGYGRLAVELYAFYTEAVNKAKKVEDLTRARYSKNYHLQVVVDGHLLSDPEGKSVTIADRVQFFVSAEQRRAAVRSLNMTRNGQYQSNTAFLQCVEAIVQETK